jgi:hypothetical protein
VEAVLFAKQYRLALLLALGVAMLCPAPARAWTEFLSMDALPENSGWTPIFYAGSSVVVNGGILTLTASSFREYTAPPNPSSHADEVDAGPQRSTPVVQPVPLQLGHATGPAPDARINHPNEHTPCVVDLEADEPSLAERETNPQRPHIEQAGDD